jgi:Collagen triple helix repeat (20 copies)
LPGTQGNKGETGSQGFDGATGPQGIAGSKGHQGSKIIRAKKESFTTKQT